ncbi:MAG: TerB family tellurite resistance protein [Sulfuricurvum sp.]
MKNSKIFNIVNDFKKLISDNSIYFYPDIPEKKLHNAINQYAFIEKNEQPLVLIDDTVFGSAKCGMLLTDKSIYAKEDFEDGVEYKISTINNIDFGGIVSNKIYINKNLLRAFTQPNKKSIVLIIDMLKQIAGIESSQQSKKDESSWVKTAIGAGIGGLVGGPIGAAIGAAIGASFTTKHISDNAPQSPEKDQSTIFTVTFASMLAKMAKADGYISEDEAILISEIFDELESDGMDKNLAKKAFNNAKNDNFTIYDYASQYSEIAEYEIREYLYDLLWQITTSDGEIHPNEDQTLKEIPSFLKLPQRKYDEYLSAFNEETNAKESQKNALNELELSYTILGCTSTDSLETIKQKYKKLVAEYHPDKIYSKGLPSSFIIFATEQTQKINNAYETIKNHKN